MVDGSTSKSASARNPFGLEWPVFPIHFALSSNNFVKALPEYTVDALQRSVLFLDLLRQRGNEEIEISSQPMATVLHYDHEIIMNGRSSPRPINYALSRIPPPPGVVIDPHKRPVVVVDPRAGQGPGISGYKEESQIGAALKAGHTVYFIGFGAIPEPGQRFLDVVEGQVKFFERVIELHPDAPLPFAIGNCQAGYQTLMVAMLRPDLFGPCLVTGSPMSFWHGWGNKQRSIVPMNDDLQKALKQALKTRTSDYVIEYGKKQAKSLKKVFARLVDDCGVECIPHVLRHTAATWMVYERRSVGGGCKAPRR